MGLDLLATKLADQFGSMHLFPPAEYGSDILLFAHVAVPDDERVRVALEPVLNAVMLDFLGAKVRMQTMVYRHEAETRTGA